MLTGLGSVGPCGPHKLWHSTWEERMRKKNGMDAINLMQKRLQKRLFYCFHRGKSWILKYIRKRRWKQKMKNIFFLSLCSRISKIKLSVSYYFYWKIWGKNPYAGKFKAQAQIGSKYTVLACTAFVISYCTVMQAMHIIYDFLFKIQSNNLWCWVFNLLMQTFSPRSSDSSMSKKTLHLFHLSV